MTLQVDISPEAQASLAAQAGVRGLALEQYAGRLLEEAATLRSTGAQKLTREGLRALTRELQRGSEKLPILPPEATERASFYEERR
jgi:hypothetical protein